MEERGRLDVVGAEQRADNPRQRPAQILGIDGRGAQVLDGPLDLVPGARRDGEVQVIGRVVRRLATYPSRSASRARR